MIYVMMGKWDVDKRYRIGVFGYGVYGVVCGDIGYV